MMSIASINNLSYKNLFRVRFYVNIPECERFLSQHGYSYQSYYFCILFFKPGTALDENLHFINNIRAKEIVFKRLVILIFLKQ